MQLDTSEFARFEHTGWERAAPQYEASWSSLTRLFIPHLLAAVNLKSPGRLLDVACGPGYVAEAARAEGLEGTGVDFSAAMIRLGRQRSPEIDFQEGDAQSLPFEDGQFDFVVMNFGLRHLSDPERAFAEAARVLRPQGRFGFTVWAEPTVNPGAKIVDDAVSAHADISVDVPKGPQYFGFTDGAECARILARSGFAPASVKCERVTAVWNVPTADFLFDAEMHGGVRTAALLSAQTPAALYKIRQQIRESVLAHGTPNGFGIQFAANIVAASSCKPSAEGPGTQMRSNRRS